MTRDFTHRMKIAGTETAFEVLALATQLEAKGKNIVHLEIGEPDFDTPENIKEAAIRAIKSGYTHYTPAPGIPELREAIAQKVTENTGVTLDYRENVVVMPGAKPCIYSAIMALIEEGDEAIIPDPAFPIYESVVNICGGRPVLVELKEENGFRLNAEDIRKAITSKTKLLVLNSPHNPCGSTLTKKDLVEIAELVYENDLWVISDEVYSRILYDTKHYSIFSEANMKERTVLVDGFSKTFAMTGWRMGYAIGPKEIIDHMTRLQININSCVTAFSQIAAIEAINGPQDEISRMIEEYDIRRKTVVDGLNGINGITCQIPTGAFYVFPNITELNIKSEDLMKKILNEAQVATLHGTAFGRYGEGYLRLSYATNIENIKEGIKRIDEYVSSELV